MPVEVKLETFNFARYGTVPGTVRRLGRDAIKAQDQGSRPDGRASGELVYPARIRLSRATISVEGRDMLISPGMKATAEIKTDQRRVIDFLLERVLGTMQTAGRER